MPTYKVRIKDGVRYGVNNHEGGEEIVVTEGAVRSFGDKFVVLEKIPDDEPLPEKTAEEIAVEAEARAAEVVRHLEEVFGPRIVEEKVEPQELAKLQRRMRNGEVPKLEETIGPHLAGKLNDAGYGDPITVFYAEDGDLTAIDGIGRGTLKRLRDVYGKAN